MEVAARRIRELEELSGAQRSAILIMYLSQDVGRKVLEQLSTEEIHEVSRAMAEVEDVEPQVIEQLVAEFIRDLGRLSIAPRDGRSFALRVLPRMLDEKRRTKVMRSLRRELSTEFPEYIASRAPEAVAAVLAEEHPQTQAVALLLMGTQNAARVLGQMEEDLRGDLSMRLARIEHIPADLADEVERLLRDALEGEAAERWMVKGIDQAAQLLRKLKRPVQEPILWRIAAEDEQLSENLRRRMVTFTHLQDVDDRGIQALLKSVERQTLLTALKGAKPDQLDLFLRNMSQRAAADIEEELELMRKPPKSEIRTAQESMVQTAMQLEEEGILRLTPDDEDDEDD